jgi:prolyl oligopeptidase PreP (S9A serine peptidase family)
MTFFTAEHFLGREGKFERLDLPADVRLGTWREHLLVTLRKDWTVGGRTFPAGALLTLPWERFLAGERDFAILFAPGPREALAGYSTTRGHILINTLANVRSRILVATPRPGGGWHRAPLPASVLPPFRAQHDRPRARRLHEDAHGVRAVAHGQERVLVHAACASRTGTMHAR